MTYCKNFHAVQNTFTQRMRLSKKNGTESGYHMRRREIGMYALSANLERTDDSITTRAFMVGTTLRKVLRFVQTAAQEWRNNMYGYDDFSLMLDQIEDACVRVERQCEVGLGNPDLLVALRAIYIILHDALIHRKFE